MYGPRGGGAKITEERRKSVENDALAYVDVATEELKKARQSEQV